MQLAEAHSQKPPLLLFDFDGVIADSLHVFYPCFVEICAECGFPLASQADFLRLFEDNVTESLLREGFPLPRLRKLARDFAPRIAEANRQCRPFSGMISIISDLAATHPLIVITSNNTEPVEDFIATHEITGVRVVMGADIEPSKVKKIREIKRQFPKRQAFYIGDTKGDMLEGRKAGAVTIGATWGWHPRHTLAEATPNYLLDAPEQLRRLFLAAPSATTPRE